MGLHPDSVKTNQDKNFASNGLFPHQLDRCKSWIYLQPVEEQLDTRGNTKWVIPEAKPLAARL